jgi:hypothetical protein
VPELVRKDPFEEAALRSAAGDDEGIGVDGGVVVVGVKHSPAPWWPQAGLSVFEGRDRDLEHAPLAL